MLIEFDYGADGIWMVSTKEEVEASTYEEWSRVTTALYGPPRPPLAHRPWGDLLSDQVLDDLKAWNDSWDYTIVQEDEGIVDDEVLEERGRELAVRVQNELGTDGWEVFYHLSGRVYRVHPAGSWPEATWRQDAVGHSPPDPRALAEEEARVLEGLREHQQQSGTEGPVPAEQRGRSTE